MNKSNTQKSATLINYQGRAPLYSATYEEQYFQINLNDLNLPDNPTVEEVLIAEWNNLTRFCEIGYDPRDPSGFQKPQKRKKALDKHLSEYLNNTNHTKKEFLSHFQYMLEEHRDFVDRNDEIILREWLTSHLILLDHSKKTVQKEGLYNQTKAYIIHFRVQMGDIPAEYDKKRLKAIKRGSYFKYGDKESYHEYLKIINDKVQPDVIVRSCKEIIEIDGLNPAIIAQAKKFIPR